MVLAKASMFKQGKFAKLRELNAHCGLDYPHAV
jgi:hypothetical protein